MLRDYWGCVCLLLHLHVIPIPLPYIIKVDDAKRALTFNYIRGLGKLSSALYSGTTSFMLGTCPWIAGLFPIHLFLSVFLVAISPYNWIIAKRNRHIIHSSHPCDPPNWILHILQIRPRCFALLDHFASDVYLFPFQDPSITSSNVRHPKMSCLDMSENLPFKRLSYHVPAVQKLQ